MQKSLKLSILALFAFVLLVPGATISVFGQSPDTTPPVITIPSDIFIETPNNVPQYVQFSYSAIDDVDGTVNVSCSYPSNYDFPIGTTTVNCTATDTAGNTATESFTITVTYAEIVPPVIIIPSDIEITTTNNSPVPVTFSVSATDNEPGIITPTCSPSSGSDFPIGATTGYRLISVEEGRAILSNKGRNIVFSLYEQDTGDER